MGMLGLRRAASGRGLGGKHVALDDRDFPEMPGDRLSGGKAGHAGANNHGMTSCNIWHVFLLGGDLKRINEHVGPAAPGKPSLSDYFWGDGEGHHKFGLEAHHQEVSSTRLQTAPRLHGLPLVRAPLSPQTPEPAPFTSA